MAHSAPLHSATIAARIPALRSIIIFIEFHLTIGRWLHSLAETPKSLLLQTSFQRKCSSNLQNISPCPRHLAPAGSCTDHHERPRKPLPPSKRRAPHVKGSPAS